MSVIRLPGTIKRYNHKENSVAIVARVGYDYNQYIGLEARGIKDFAEDEKASITHAGVFIKPMYPVTKELNIYGLIGMAKTKTSGGYPKVDSESLALGGGVEYDISKIDLRVENTPEILMGAGDQERGLGTLLRTIEKIGGYNEGMHKPLMPVTCRIDFTTFKFKLA